jgi:hypothetical protein
MTGYVLFHMWPPAKKMLIERHKFFLEQARKRLLSQFSNLKEDADQAAEEWLERAGRHFDPDRDDPGSFEEAAYHEGIAFYQQLEDMRDSVRLSVVAGMFHEWDKQLRDWMVREILHWHRGDEVRAKVWAQDFGGLVDLFASFGWDIKSKPYWAMLDACRLVVNVYKHGDGGSFRDLKQRYPQYLQNPLKDFGAVMQGVDFIDYTDLNVSEDHINEFSDAIVAFWTDVPERIHEGQVGEMPKWFEKAWLKDGKALKRRPNDVQGHVSPPEAFDFNCRIDCCGRVVRWIFGNCGALSWPLSTLRRLAAAHLKPVIRQSGTSAIRIVCGSSSPTWPAALPSDPGLAQKLQTFLESSPGTVDFKASTT